MTWEGAFAAHMRVTLRDNSDADAHVRAAHAHLRALDLGAADSLYYAPKQSRMRK